MSKRAGGRCIACGARLERGRYVCPVRCLPTRDKPKGTK